MKKLFLFISLLFLSHYAFCQRTTSNNSLMIKTEVAVLANNLSDLPNAGTARTNLGATTIGNNIFTLTNPSIDGYLRINSDNTVTGRSYSNVRNDLGLVVGTNIQAYDADLDTWAGITPGSGVGTFLATPSSANLISAVTDETGTGALVFGTSPVLTTPKIDNAGYIADGNGNELIIFNTTASAVNEITFANGATGNNPSWTASGETNVGIDWAPKGTGKFNFKATTSGETELRLFEDADNGSNYIGIISQANIGSNKTITLPDLTGTVDLIDAAQTFSAVKTFSSAPVISSITNTGTLTLPTIAGTMVQYVETSISSNATWSPAGDARENWYVVTAQGAAVTTISNPTGTTNRVNGNVLIIRVKDNGTARALSWTGSEWRAGDIPLPSTTVLGKTMYIKFIFNNTDTKWDLVGVVDNL